MRIDLSELMRLRSRLADIRDNISKTLSYVKNEIDDITDNVVSSGLAEANNQVKEEISSLSLYLTINLSKLEEFMLQQISGYTMSNEEARDALDGLISFLNSEFNEDGSVINSVSNTTGVSELGGLVVGGVVSGATVTGTVTSNAANGELDISVYHNNPEKGFIVTTGNTTYNLTAEEYDLICSIVAAESDHSYDDALAVTTTILNRCESSKWANYGGNSPVKQATYPSQFVVYEHGTYMKFTNGKAPNTVQKAVSDALAGVRNHNYDSFRSNRTYSYGDNMITETGNRYS